MASGMLSSGMMPIPGMAESPHSELMDAEEIQRKGEVLFLVFFLVWVCLSANKDVLSDIGILGLVEISVEFCVKLGGFELPIFQVFNMWGRMVSRWLGTSGSMPILEKSGA